MARRNHWTRADHDACAETCGKLLATCRHQWTNLRTLYPQKLLTSIAPQLLWPYSGGRILTQASWDLRENIKKASTNDMNILTTIIVQSWSAGKKKSKQMY